MLFFPDIFLRIIFLKLWSYGNQVSTDHIKYHWVCGPYNRRKFGQVPAPQVDADARRWPFGIFWLWRLLAGANLFINVWKVLPFQTVSHRIDASSRCASVAGRRIAKDDIFLPAEGTCEDRAYLLHTCFRSGCDLLLLCEHLQNAFCMQWRILSFPPNLLAPFLFSHKINQGISSEYNRIEIAGMNLGKS